ncbi:NAD(P)H-quinone oxidoreductase subunit 3 [Campylobacter sp. CNRCH_2015_0814]|uniref:NAD(P)H-quinone oxidoreductase subunit 3 n=1 Tax=Campylobacter sp. CNRCH_2015_0814 TaxID=2911606 RepID=UPI0021E69CF9|nr:NAD(P)H-quinone oxidoreductase subunit 3 [Campylobacter sp. CNRCH_2015_0814]MCV3470666.1 NAD(P)H-quinone oxidoreductase subunit 3 [Campylobacter sp. CNRCH_2015_0814]
MTHATIEHQYFGIFAMLVIASVIFFTLVYISSKIGSKLASHNRKKLGLGIYECGPMASKQANKINSQFFVFTLIFILLDIEVVFLFPWAVIFKDLTAELSNYGLSLFALVEVFVFILLLAIGFLYAYKKGAFAWQSIKK